MCDSIEKSTTGLEIQSGGPQAAVALIKHELGNACEPVGAVASPMIPGGAQSDYLGVSVVKEEAACWDDTEAGDADAEMCGENETIEDITVTKHELCVNEEEVGENLVIKEEPVGDEEVRGDVALTAGTYSIKRELVDPEFVSVDVKGEPPAKEAATMMKVDPLAESSKRRRIQENTAYDRAAQKFLSMEEGKLNILKGMQSAVARFAEAAGREVLARERQAAILERQAAILEREAVILEKKAAAREREAAALERIASAAEAKYGKN